ncbi:hypothetical protein QBC39DRAFT_3660 [Podospora conica]|nr:hypothetical protein QBC39DRAFT_3660 [Schizothecium conicum]
MRNFGGFWMGNISEEKMVAGCLRHTYWGTCDAPSHSCRHAKPLLDAATRKSRRHGFEHSAHVLALKYKRHFKETTQPPANLSVRTRNASTSTSLAILMLDNSIADIISSKAGPLFLHRTLGPQYTRIPLLRILVDIDILGITTVPRIPGSAYPGHRGYDCGVPPYPVDDTFSANCRHVWEPMLDASCGRTVARGRPGADKFTLLSFCQHSNTAPFCGKTNPLEMLCRVEPLPDGGGVGTLWILSRQLGAPDVPFPAMFALDDGILGSWVGVVSSAPLRGDELLELGTSSGDVASPPRGDILGLQMDWMRVWTASLLLEPVRMGMVLVVLGLCRCAGRVPLEVLKLRWKPTWFEV